MNFIVQNYIALSKRYWRLFREGDLLPGDSHLYWALMHEFSERGQKDLWPDSIRFTDPALATLAGINVKTVDAARKRLVAKGLIRIDILGQGNRSGNVYWLLDVNSQAPPTSPKNGEVNGEVRGGVIGEVNGVIAATSPKNGEVNGYVNGEVADPLPPSLPQQHTQQPTQNLEKSPIYNEYQTQTETQTLKKESVSASEVDLTSQNPEPQNSPSPQVAAVPPSPKLAEGAPATNRADLLFTFRSASEKTNVPFSHWYLLYEYKWGEDQARRLWLELSDDERETAIKHTPPYVKSTADKRYRLTPANYLNDKAFNNEIIDRHENNANSDANANGAGNNDAAREVIRTEYTKQKFGGRKKIA